MINYWNIYVSIMNIMSYPIIIPVFLVITTIANAEFKTLGRWRQCDLKWERIEDDVRIGSWTISLKTHRNKIISAKHFLYEVCFELTLAKVQNMSCWFFQSSHVTRTTTSFSKEMFFTFTVPTTMDSSSLTITFSRETKSRSIFSL